jgi:type VI secretion system protein ImpH
MDIPADCHLTLGTNPQNGRLGQDTVIGTSVWGVQQKFRIVLGPVSYDHMKRLLPDGPSVRKFRSLVRYFVGDEKDWDVQIVVDGADVPASRLGESMQLGWTSWLGKKLPGSDSGDLIFSLHD